jgi:hypothetical protein
VESFGSRLRNELLAVEAFTSLLEARVLGRVSKARGFHEMLGVWDGGI